VFGIITILVIIGLFVLMLHNVWLYEVTAEYPNIPMTKLEAKCMDIKSRLQEIKYRNIQREVQANYDSNNYYDRGNSL
jgi:hypothetical protein